MLLKKWSVLVVVFVLAGFVLAACPAPTTPVVPAAQTVVVTVKETVVSQVEVTKVVETIKEVVATPTPEARPKVLRINLGAYPDIIDPQKSAITFEIAHLQLIYDGLTRLNEKLETIPAAAAKWKYNDDATQLVFTLRPDLKYSDGSLLNAERYAYAIKRNINPETAGDYAQITDEISGAPEWRGFAADTAKSAEENQAAFDAASAQVNESVKASQAGGAACTGYDDAACDTLTLSLSRPAPYFHTVMSLWVTYPAKEENIAEGGENWWNSSKYQIGNGPYILKTLEPFVRAYFTPNPNYWAGTAKTDIESSYINDTSVAFQAYKNDEFDMISAAPEDLETIKADAQLSKELTSYPGACTTAIGFHLLRAPFTDQKVREAFAMAFDREGYVRDVLRGLGTPILTWIPPGFQGYDAKENRWGYDPEAARAALAASSYGSADKLPPITATFPDSPRNRSRWEWLIAKWKEVLGVDITADPVEPTTFTALMKDINTAPQMLTVGWCADYPDAQNWLSVPWKTGGSLIGYSNPEFDALVNEADTTVDPAKRAKLYGQAQTLLTGDAPAAFGWTSQNNYLIKPWVKGIITTPQDFGFAGMQAPLSIDIDPSMLPQ